MCACVCQALGRFGPKTFGVAQHPKRALGLGFGPNPKPKNGFLDPAAWVQSAGPDGAVEPDRPSAFGLERRPKTKPRSSHPQAPSQPTAPVDSKKYAGPLQERARTQRRARWERCRRRRRAGGAPIKAPQRPSVVHQSPSVSEHPQSVHQTCAADRRSPSRYAIAGDVCALPCLVPLRVLAISNSAISNCAGFSRALGGG